MNCRCWTRAWIRSVSPFCSSRLESVLGVDPFSEDEDDPFPVHLGEFIRFYENAEQ
jgi:hypothetical protein